MKGILRSGLTARRARREHLSLLSMMAGRVLILFTAFLLAVMPLTEHFWTFDGIICGGQDFEFGLLSIVTILCLVLVVSQHRKQGVALLLCIQRWLWSIFPSADPMMSVFCDSAFEGVGRTPLACTGLSLYTLPLQI